MTFIGLVAWTLRPGKRPFEFLTQFFFGEIDGGNLILCHEGNSSARDTLNMRHGPSR